VLPYHRVIQDAISEFGRLHMGKDVLSVSNGGERLVIIHGTKPLSPIYFKPDRIFTLNDTTKVAFQILGSQAEKFREIEADTFRAYLCPGISKLVFIAPTTNDADNVSRITAIIQDGLAHLGVKKDKLFLVLTIPRNVRKASAVRFYLNQPKINREIFGKA
jgi:hypothetical protein